MASRASTPTAARRWRARSPSRRRSVARSRSRPTSPARPPAGDIDAILLGVAGEESVRAAWREIERRVQAAGRPWTGAVVQPLVAPGADVLVGAVRDRRGPRDGDRPGRPPS